MNASEPTLTQALLTLQQAIWTVGAPAEVRAAMSDVLRIGSQEEARLNWLDGQGRVGAVQLQDGTTRPARAWAITAALEAGWDIRQSIDAARANQELEQTRR